MLIRLWNNFTKRKNSTKQPVVDTDTVEMHVSFKEDTSLENPVFIIEEPYPHYTYVQAFSDYYFVTDIVNLDNYRSEIHCTMDVLATYKSNITSYHAFVERASSSYDEFLIDPALSIQQKYASDTVTATSLSQLFDRDGCFVVTCMTATRGITLYLVNNLRPFRTILDPDCYDNQSISEWIDSKISQAYDLDVYIGSVKWVPIDLDAHGTQIFPVISGNSYTDNPFVVGPVRIPERLIPSTSVIKWIYPSSLTLSTQLILSVPSAYYNDFRDCDPRFTQYSLTLPGVGTVPLDSSFVGSCIHNSRDIYLQVYGDWVTGNINYIISTYVSGSGLYSKYTEFRGNIACDVTIGKSASNFANTLSGLIGGTTNALTSAMSENVAGAVGASLQTGVNFISNMVQDQLTIFGGSGNRGDLWAHSGNAYLNRRVFGSRNYPHLDVAGRPLMRYVQLSTLSGYVKCGNASVPLNARDSERDAVNGYLNSGFYIE